MDEASRVDFLPYQLLPTYRINNGLYDDRLIRHSLRNTHPTRSMRENHSTKTDMHRRKMPKASYQKVDADSGYLSDLVDTARKSDEAAAKTLLSSSASVRSRSEISINSNFPSSLRSSELFMNTFDDTEWDVKTTGAQLGVINRRCSDLAKQVMKPTRFPIIPLECTLARARAKAEMRQRRRSASESDELANNCNTREPTVVDRRGRTRAAARKAAADEDESGQLWEGLDEVQQKTSRKRKSCQEQNTEQRKASKRRQTR
jgi:hypothetical protein